MANGAAAEEVRREQILRAAFEVAARAGISGVTLRAVAAEAGLSHALVLFYFGRKDRLLHELLEWLLENASVVRLPDDVARHPGARDRLHALLQQEMTRVAQAPRQTRLFFEFWALGARQPAIRARIGEELEAYRAAFRAVMQELIDAEPAAFPAASASGLAAVAVSWIHGGALQAIIGPENFDTEEYVGAVRAIAEQLTRTGGAAHAEQRS